jgi:histidinol-phosphate/aromatic aminotransferase/cobyric acid decarboxylase-like protein
MPISVPLINIARQTASSAPNADEAIARVLDSGQFILGPEVAQLEEKISDYCGAKFAIACASGSDALLLPLIALKVQPGDTVITTPFTFFASAGSISRAGVACVRRHRSRHVQPGPGSAGGAMSEKDEWAHKASVVPPGVTSPTC